AAAGAAAASGTLHFIPLRANRRREPAREQLRVGVGLLRGPEGLLRVLGLPALRSHHAERDVDLGLDGRSAALLETYGELLLDVRLRRPEGDRVVLAHHLLNGIVDGRVASGRQRARARHEQRENEEKRQQASLQARWHANTVSEVARLYYDCRSRLLPSRRSG